MKSLLLRLLLGPLTIICFFNLLMETPTALLLVRNLSFISFTPCCLSCLRYNIIVGTPAKAFFEKSGLAKAMLAQIWYLILLLSNKILIIYIYRTLADIDKSMMQDCRYIIFLSLL